MFRAKKNSPNFNYIFRVPRYHPEQNFTWQVLMRFTIYREIKNVLEHKIEPLLVVINNIYCVYKNRDCNYSSIINNYHTADVYAFIENLNTFSMHKIHKNI